MVTRFALALALTLLCACSKPQQGSAASTTGDASGSVSDSDPAPPDGARDALDDTVAGEDPAATEPDLPVVPDSDPLSDPGPPDGGDGGEEQGDGADGGAEVGAEEELPPSPPVRVRSCTTTLRFDSDPGASQVILAGEWDWLTLLPMRREGDAWLAELELPAGVYCYKLIVDGEWMRDPKNSYEKYCDGARNSALRVPDCGLPELRLEGPPERPDAGLRATALFWAGSDGAAPAEVRAEISRAFESEPVSADWDADAWKLSVELSDLPEGKHTLRLWATDSAGRETDALLLPFWVEDEPFDWRDAVIFMAMTDRFVNGDPTNDPPPSPGSSAEAEWRGGDYAGLLERIEDGYLESLGVRALWITPPNTGAAGAEVEGGRGVTGYHGYWPVAAREVDPRLGGADGLEAVVRAAHARGIRVITDFVINHVHEDHEYATEHQEWFNDGCLCGTEGCDWTAEALTCLFRPYMPDVSWTHPEASEAFVADALWWLERFDLDGFRVDAVKHVPELAVFNLGTRVRERFEAAGTNYFLVGETATGWGGDDLDASDSEYEIANRYLGPDGLDGQFDFTLFHAVVTSSLLRGERGFIHLDVWTGKSQEEYRPGSVIVPYVGSHDTSRALSVADYRGQDPEHPGEVAYHGWAGQVLPERPGEEEPYHRLRAAFCWLLTIPGAPMIYMGDEYGQHGGADPDNRQLHRPVPELNDREAALLAAVRALGGARRENPALRRGGYRTLGATEEVLPFLREADGATALVVINGSGAERSVTREVPEGAAGWQEIIGLGAAIGEAGSGATITVPARSCGVFVP